jgi:hypothetical protein
MLETKRLHIRELSSADLENIHQLHSLPETDEFNTLGYTERYSNDRKNSFRVVVTPKADTEKFLYFLHG